MNMNFFLEPSLFESNWLGKLWTSSIIFFLLIMVLGVLQDYVDWALNKRGVYEAPESMVLRVHSRAWKWFVALSLLTIVVWDLSTAAKLLALSLLATGGFALLYLGLRRLLLWRSQRNKASETPVEEPLPPPVTEEDFLARFDRNVARQDSEAGEEDMRQSVPDFGMDVWWPLVNRFRDNPSFRDTFRRAHTETVVFLTHLDQMTVKEYSAIASRILAHAANDPWEIHAMRHHHLAHPSGIAGRIIAQLTDADSLKLYTERRDAFQEQYRAHFPERAQAGQTPG